MIIIGITGTLGAGKGTIVDYLIAQYNEAGRFSLNIAVGCTGGQHRSVAVANALARHLTVNDEDVRLLNRDRKRG